LASWPQSAVELAKGIGDLEDWSAAQADLGEVYKSLGNVVEAIKHLEEAKKGYVLLGDSQRAAELKECIAELEP
jgi:hypothetical protein